MSKGKLKKYNKITTGFVIQEFELQEDGKFVCTEQNFTAGAPVDRENEFGEDISREISRKQEVYQPFDMVQPEKE